MPHILFSVLWVMGPIPSRHSAGPVRSLVRLWRGFATALTLVFLVVTCTPLIPTVAVWLAGPWPPAAGKVLIVLSGDTFGPEYLGASTFLRTHYAVRLWRGGGFERVVVAGRESAPLMRDFLIGHGVPAAAIVVENRSGSTRENALECRRLLSGVAGPYVLLSSDFHMRRAAGAFRAAGLNVVPAPLPDVLKRASRPLERWTLGYVEGQELVKLLYYRFQGWLA